VSLCTLSQQFNQGGFFKNKKNTVWRVFQLIQIVTNNRGKQWRHLGFLAGNESEAVRDRYHFSGLSCYLMCIWIALLTKHFKNIFPKNFIGQKTPDNMSCGKVIQE